MAVLVAFPYETSRDYQVYRKIVVQRLHFGVNSVDSILIFAITYLPDCKDNQIRPLSSSLSFFLSGTSQTHSTVGYSRGNHRSTASIGNERTSGLRLLSDFKYPNFSSSETTLRAILSP